MDLRAIEKARSRIRAATTQLQLLAQSTSKVEYVDTWYLYLAASKSIWTAIEQGSKTSPQSRQWYGERKQERKDDPLLQYMFQARNEEEHDLNDPIKFEPPTFAFGENGQGSSYEFERTDLGDNDGTLRIQSSDGELVRVRATVAKMVLVPVTARGPVIYHPPKTHFGQVLKTDSPDYLGQLNLNYLIWMTDQAEALCTP